MERLSVLKDNSLVPRSGDIDKLVRSLGVDCHEFNIEEYWSVVDRLARMPGADYVRLDFGIPGLLPSVIARDTHSKLLGEGTVSAQYPPHAGLPHLNSVLSRFMARQLAVSVAPADVFVTCGATQALFVAQAVAARLMPSARSVAFLTPNYPPMRAQARFLGMNIVSIDVDGKRGDALIEAIREAFESGEVAALCWASPSNPGWMIPTEYELASIADLCRTHGVIPIEDLTYLGMAAPGGGGLPSIAHHTDEYFLVLSSSKMLSYAGERVGFLIGSPSLLARGSPGLETAFAADSVRRACGSFIFNLTAGAPHSAQYAVASVLDAVNKGQYPLAEALSVYKRRARRLNALLEKNGFYTLYTPQDDGTGDGFYVNFGYPGLSELTLLKALLRVGVAVLPLSIFGSARTDGVRACVGRLEEEMIPVLETRLAGFGG